MHKSQHSPVRIHRLQIIFDWSGTLADEKDLSFTSTRDTIVYFGGKKISRTLFDKTIRLPISEFYHDYLPAHPMQKINPVFHRFYNQAASQAPLFPGIQQLLEHLAQRADLHILSSLDVKPIEQSLKKKGIRHLFKTLNGGADDKSQLLEKLFKNHVMERLDSLYVGDMTHDIQAAKKCSIPSIAVGYGYHTTQKLKECQPDHLAATPQDLASLLNHILSWQAIKTPIMTVGALIRNPSGECLFVKTQKWGGRWGIPGGKVEYGENLVSALKREMKEETGLSVSKPQLLMIQEAIENPQFYRPRHFILANYQVYCTRKAQVELNYESQDLKWLKPQEALRLNLNQPTRKLVRYVLSKI